MLSSNTLDVFFKQCFGGDEEEAEPAMEAAPHGIVGLLSHHPFCFYYPLFLFLLDFALKSAFYLLGIVLFMRNLYNIEFQTLKNAINSFTEEC